MNYNTMTLTQLQIHAYDHAPAVYRQLTAKTTRAQLIKWLNEAETVVIKEQATHITTTISGGHFEKIIIGSVIKGDVTFN